MEEIWLTSWYGAKYPIIYIVSIQISGGLLALGFLSEPSTVSDF